jgi:hypothetical protein
LDNSSGAFPHVVLLCHGWPDLLPHTPDGIQVMRGQVGCQGVRGALHL